MTYSEITSRPGVILIEFYASWCPHCRKMMPVVEKLRDQLEGQADVVRLDVDSDTEAAEEAKANSVPLFVIFKDGKEMWRQSGEMDGQALLSKVQSYL
ncbi:MAG: thioredoxin family protein [Duncaniella sp.]|nr:thioredoxin family protein [Duncaniella sp.]MDE5733790.1 thioredoxin family protein [Duncaniella sp.]MDE6177839.1 thioredoxin family protein [Duncaniella sp.]MDE6390383.1 thioredoxin family protein [Duncaniella sp.]